MPVMYELFAGTHSISRVAKARGWDCITVDIDPKFNPDVCANILDLPVDFGPQGFVFVVPELLETRLNTEVSPS